MGSTNSTTKPSASPSQDKPLDKPIWNPSWDPRTDPSALHELGQMLEPISSRLAWASQALAAGRDPNALEDNPRSETNRNRPLHAALEHAGDWDSLTGQPRDRAESLDLIRFLLEHGADPRLRDCLGKHTPAQRARQDALIDASEGGKRFLLDAAEILEEAERMLNEKDEKAASEKSLGQDDREVVCRFCRDGRKHDWHYWSYADTGEERRTFEVTDNEIKGLP